MPGTIVTDGFPFAATAQGINVTWGTTTITITSLSYSRSAESEVDVTAMDSYLVSDTENTDRPPRLMKEVEYTIVDPGELQCEFIGPGDFGDEAPGLMKTLAVTGLTNCNGGRAILKSMSVQAKAGELITGSCTFRLTSSPATITKVTSGQ